MFVCLTFILAIAVAPVFSGIIKNEIQQTGCSVSEFSCGNGECVRLDKLCDGRPDCIDGLDESVCEPGSSPSTSGGQLNRIKRQLRNCPSGHGYCNDYSCVPLYALCDGFKDCLDGSDEEYTRCRSNGQGPGQCVLPSFPVNGRYKIGDSDSFIPHTRYDGSKTFKIVCYPGYAVNGPDEMTLVCGDEKGLPKCERACDLPPHHSVEYTCVTRDDTNSTTRPCRAKEFRGTTVVPKCREPDYVGSPNNMYCVGGAWNYISTCTAAFCDLSPHPSVEYTCVTGEGSSSTSSPCGAKVPSGTTVVPKCRPPNYRGAPRDMHCAGGVWDYIATCPADCGRTTPDGKEYVIDGTRARHGAIPWHAGVYRKTSTPYKHICGATLVNTNTIITAAHCFWDDVEGQRPAHIYAAALGKIYRPWSDPNDRHAQFSNITEINIPQQFRGAANNFQDDIAVVKLETEIVYQTFIRPVCLNLDRAFSQRQLQPGSLGKVSGWGLSSADGRPSSVLQVAELPYVTYDTCFDESPPEFREYISGDKFCAGFTNGTALCEGDSGGGLAFPLTEARDQRYFLQGVVSTAPRNHQRCDPNARAAFTEVVKHEHFIRSFVDVQYSSF